MNKLFFGDCLDILKDLYKKHPGGFIDLIYIDPPFNSKRDYNILFESVDLKDANAQKQAFSDTWSNVSYVDTLNEVKTISLNLYKFLESLDNVGIHKGAVSYLSTMALRIWYMHKVLKDTGSFYLHCDPTMSHYLKIICDLIFHEKNFLNEIAWCYKTRHFSKRHFGRKHDIILMYSKTGDYKFYWEEVLRPLSPETIKKYRHVDEKGRYRLSGRGIKGSPIQSAKDVDPKWEKTNPELVVRDYLKEGVPVEDYWNIEIINQSAKERLGYPTQKPESLLERIIKASTKENDIVADFFCGCGTSIAVAQKLKRKWIGVDISHLAIKLIIDRLTKPYKKARAKIIRENIEVAGFPRDIASAKELAENSDAGRLGFQDWIIEVMLGGVANTKKSGDGGFDGYLTFLKNEKERGIILVEVKSGKVGIKNIREFIHVVEQRKADLGVFVCFNEYANKNMVHEAKIQGFYDNQYYPFKFDRIQILTVEELLEGKEIHLPSDFFVRTTFKNPSTKMSIKEPQQSLFE